MWSEDGERYYYIKWINEILFFRIIWSILYIKKKSNYDNIDSGDRSDNDDDDSGENNNNFKIKNDINNNDDYNNNIVDNSIMLIFYFL